MSTTPEFFVKVAWADAGVDDGMIRETLLETVDKCGLVAKEVRNYNKSVLVDLATKDDETETDLVLEHEMDRLQDLWPHCRLLYLLKHEWDVEGYAPGPIGYFRI